MGYRRHVSAKKSRRLFRRTSGSKRINSTPPMMRGGRRM